MGLFVDRGFFEGPDLHIGQDQAVKRRSDSQRDDQRERLQHAPVDHLFTHATLTQFQPSGTLLKPRSFPGFDRCRPADSKPRDHLADPRLLHQSEAGGSALSQGTKRPLQG